MINLIRLMNLAETTAEFSHAKRLKVGAVIVDKMGYVLASGYNRAMHPYAHECECPDSATYPHVMHAEENAILSLARGGGIPKDTILVVTHQPCVTCSRMIYGADISAVYYKHPYRCTKGRDILKTCGIKVEHYLGRDVAG